AATRDGFKVEFDPRLILANPQGVLQRPQFLAIVASPVLALTLARKSNGKVDGFVIEHHSAGGHNAPPRGRACLNRAGEPIYSDRDDPDLAAMRAIGAPFWLAGSYGHPSRLCYAREQGAVGVQVGTAFAFCQESGLSPQLKSR